MEYLEDVLEGVLREVEGLKRDLHAEVIVQKEEGHEEHVEIRGRGDEGRNIYDSYDTYIVDRSEIRAPDTQKREASRTELQQLYACSQWYSARYSAGRALNISNQELNTQLEGWVDALGKQLSATKTELRGVPAESCYEDYVTQSFEVVDTETRLKTMLDASKLFAVSNSSLIKELLKRTYKENDAADIRKQAGQALGYPRLRILFHEFFMYR